MERLVLLLSQAEAGEAAGGPLPPDLYVISRGETAERQALALTRRARLAGLAVERDASGSAFGKQFKRADRSGAAWAAVIGDREAADGVVVLKDLRGDAAEQRLAPDQLLIQLVAQHTSGMVSGLG
jgi:histidyl-tRNA synthetase